MLSFLDLQQRVLRHLDEATNTGATTLALTKDFLNQAHTARCTQERWPFMLWDGQETFTLVPGQLDYHLHPECHRVLYLYNRTRNEYLAEIPMRGYEKLDPNVVDRSAPQRFALWGRSPLLVPFTPAEGLSLVSTSTADTGTTKTITVRGQVAGSSKVVSEDLVPTGTTAVTTSFAFSKVLGVSQLSPWTGECILTGRTSYTPYMDLPPGGEVVSCPVLHLFDNPNSADTIEYRFFRQPLTLVNDGDLPEIPYPHSEILVYDALILFAGYQTDLAEKSLRVWTDIRDRLERAMMHDLLELHTIGAQARFVRRTDPEPDALFPRIHLSS